jgi:hypothetical protein
MQFRKFQIFKISINYTYLMLSDDNSVILFSLIQFFLIFYSLFTLISKILFIRKGVFNFEICMADGQKC